MEFCDEENNIYMFFLSIILREIHFNIGMTPVLFMDKIQYVEILVNMQRFPGTLRTLL